MTKLEQLISMKKLPFYCKGVPDMSEQDRLDFKEYHKIEDELLEESKLLKKDDKVQFNFPKRIKDKTKMFGFSLEDQLFEGKIKIPYKTKKRTRMGEDCSYEVLKVVSGNYVYEVSPREIVKL